jgi:hypothetical protein
MCRNGDAIIISAVHVIIKNRPPGNGLYRYKKEMPNNNENIAQIITIFILVLISIFFIALTL